MPPNTGADTPIGHTQVSASQVSSRASSPASVTERTPRMDGAVPRSRPVRPVQNGSSAQLLRKITVAGVTVEVVRQNSTIIYRLPGNMPVASLTSEQRTQVMDEIQRIRNSTARVRPGAKPAGPQTPGLHTPTGQNRAQTPVSHNRIRPPLPMIIPRSTAGPHSAPGTPPNGMARAAQTPSARRPRPGAPSPGPKSALEKMYQSAYLKLLSGPAEVLRRLDPPVELSSIITDGVHTSAASLLQILKALSKTQAAQLAHMYDSTRGHDGDAMSAPSSQPQSRDGSPSGTSGAERDFADLPGAATPKRRKYNKTGKYSAKNRWGADEPSSPRDRPSSACLPNDASRTPANERILPQSKHEAEVSRRFRDALAMDHQMVQQPEWQTPFTGPHDIIQRLLPFHVFQYPDSSIDAGIMREELRAEPAAVSLDKRARALAQRYNKMMEREGSHGFYAADFAQLDHLQISALTDELEHMDDARLQRDISSVEGRLFC
ncbi:hypothetical protein IW145_002079 [Coemansia sp. RSA 521]|nr:hypothetical protein IW145_002079 [Coemansia sp. RSA 521]KAJ2275246.1 hypothetical protein J3F81_001903 [Coemansia sp. RSA 371]KAJ2282944.1 hypothetical protein GGH14_001235 [Coemansia sp. RSA 370]KAJ2729239.1 hypothetical protein H4S00_000579 [Coemansia sp. D1744]